MLRTRQTPRKDKAGRTERPALVLQEIGLKTEQKTGLKAACCGLPPSVPQLMSASWRYFVFFAAITWSTASLPPHIAQELAVPSAMCMS